MKNAIVAFLLLAIGATLALLMENLSYFQFDNDFNIFELFYFLMTTGIALFVTQKINDTLQKKKSQKDIIMHKIEELDAELKDLHTSFRHENRSYSISNAEMLFSIKRIGLLAKRYEASIKRYYNHLYNDKNFQKLNTRKLVRICTTTLTKSDDGIRCEDDVWSYTEERFLVIYKEIDSIRSLCYNNMIQLNNYN